MAEFHKYSGYTRAALIFYFFHDKSGYEVDLIIQHTGQLDALEIKYTYTIEKDHFRHLNYLKKYLDLSTSSVFYAGNQEFPDVLSWLDLKKISVLPMFSL